jgi:hypothetical protein
MEPPSSTDRDGGSDPAVVTIGAVVSFGFKGSSKAGAAARRVPLNVQPADRSDVKRIAITGFQGGRALGADGTDVDDTGGPAARVIPKVKPRVKCNVGQQDSLNFALQS